MRAKRLLPTMIFVSVVAIILAASFFRFKKAERGPSSRLRDLQSVSRIIYYRVEPEAGPRFRLAGAEKAVRIVSHLALDRGVAWPISRYRPEQRYDYGLQLVLRDPQGHQIWSKDVHLSSSVSKGEPTQGVWTQEAAFSETRTFVPTDPRITQVQLPADVAVDTSLEVRLLGANSSFAMVRAYGLSQRAAYLRWLDPYIMSPQDKQDMVNGITYLSWDEIQKEERDQRLSLDVSRLTAASSVRGSAKVIPLFVSPYRVTIRQTLQRSSPALLGPWRESFVVQGPAQLRFRLRLGSSQYLSQGQQAHRLHLTRTDAQGVTLTQSTSFHVPASADTPWIDFPFSVEPGLHTLKFRWEPPSNQEPVHALVNTRGQGIVVDHALTRDLGAAFRLEHQDPIGLHLGQDELRAPELHHPAIAPERWTAPMYYLDKRTGSIRFPIPQGSSTARLFKIEQRDWDSFQYHAQPKTLHYRFLDFQGRPLLKGDHTGIYEFDPDSWIDKQGQVGRKVGAQELRVGVGQRSALMGVAPKGSAWLELSAPSPLLVRVRARLPEHWQPQSMPPKVSAQTPVVRRPRRWIPMLAHEHSRWALEGWNLRVHTTYRDEEEHAAPEPDALEPKWWSTIASLENATTQRVLEEQVYQDAPQGLVSSHAAYPSHEDLWDNCSNCWLEIPSHHQYRVVDRVSQRQDPQLLWINDKGPQRESWMPGNCTVRVDEQERRVSCPAHRQRETLPELAGASHALSWRSDHPHTRLFVDRWSIPHDGQFLDNEVPIYLPRRLSALPEKGLTYAFTKTTSEPHYVHIRVYQGMDNEDHGPAMNPVGFELSLDHGSPPRREGQLFSHFTPPQREILAAPSHVGELLFLDDNASGAYRRFDLKLFVGRDIAMGQHRVRVRAQQSGKFWIRVFARDMGPEQTSSRISSPAPRKKTRNP